MRLIQTSDSRAKLERGDGREIFWNMSVYERTRYSTVEGDVFGEINGFWSFIPEEQRERIWLIYENISKVLNDYSDPQQLTNKLKGLIKQLYQEHKLEDVDHWVRFHGNIRLPEPLKDQYDPDDIVDMTYLRLDYIALVIMAVALRPMVPIWGEFIYRTKDAVGTTFKEFEAMKMMRDSGILTSPAMERLTRYLKAYIDAEGESFSAIISGLGSEEQPDWLLAVVVVRRIAPCDISASDSRGNIISNVYAFVKGILRDSDRRFGGGVHEKYSGVEGEGDDSMSLAEAYKMKQNVSAGDVALYSVYAENVVRMAQSIDPTIEPLRVLECERCAMELDWLTIRTNHLWFCQIVMNPSIPARGIYALNRQSLLRVMAATQALLWHWGMPELAILVTANASIEDNGAMVVMESRSRIPSELTKRLAELYPYTENVGRSGQQGKGVNVAVKAIQRVSKEFSASGWSVYAPPALRAECRLVDVSGRMVTPANIMELIAKLIIKIAQE